MSDELNYKILSQDLLRGVRGRRSQDYVNRKLGFSGNQVYRWEKGLRFIDWSDFVRVCALLDKDLEGIFRIQFGYREKSLESPQVVRHLLGSMKTPEAVRATGFSRSVLTKWMKGTTSPQLHQILKLLENPNRLLLPFVRELLGTVEIESLSKYEAQVQRMKDLYYREPVVAGLVAFLETSRFRDKKDFARRMAGVFRMDGARIENLLREMISLGIVEEAEFPAGAKIRSVDIRGSFEGALGMRRFWFGHVARALDDLRPRDEDHLFPFFIFSVSEEGSRKLREAHYRYASQLKAIIDEDAGDKKIVRAIAIGDVPLRGPGENP